MSDAPYKYCLRDIVYELRTLVADARGGGETSTDLEEGRVRGLWEALSMIQNRAQSFDLDLSALLLDFNIDGPDLRPPLRPL